MNNWVKGTLAFAVMAAMLAAVGVLQSWSLAFTIINMCLISSVMALGVNIQWGYAGLFNGGIVGFTALGGLAAMLVSMPPVTGAVSIVGGYFLVRYFYTPAVESIESFDSARTGYLGGLGLPIILSWIVGALFAAGAAWLIGKISLGLRSDYLAIATLGIAEIIVAMLKNEDWLSTRRRLSRQRVAR